MKVYTTPIFVPTLFFPISLHSSALQASNYFFFLFKKKQQKNICLFNLVEPYSAHACNFVSQKLVGLLRTILWTL